ncbi:MAG: DUF86 domain-containing protein [Candidatus Lokiarchaeota archaeon]|nr:DUF86 domain-containing protein [Candidatus Lokiarchaeota archaeon]
MSRDHKLYVKDILIAIENIFEFTLNMSFNEFHKNKLVQHAVIRNLEIIGEAVKKIPDQIKEKNKEKIDWRAISGLRDILIHKYFEVNLQLLWDIIENKLLDLKNNLSSLI